MAIQDEGFAVLLPEAQHWRNSNIMKIPNANLLHALGGSERFGGRLWRLPPYSANTWHKHIESWEFYFVIEGTGRMRVGDETVTVPRYGSVLVAPHMLRQVFNDTPSESLWLIVAAPQEGAAAAQAHASEIYPNGPRSLPPELTGRVWPPNEE